MKKVAIFDLDGTLAESKQQMSLGMRDALDRLARVMHIAVITGGPWSQIEQQINSVAGDLHITFFLPVSGSQMYQRVVGQGWKRIYGEDLSFREKRRIYNAWFEAVLSCDDEQAKDIACCPIPEWGEVAEDRGSQMTFSMLGQGAPLEKKREWDPRGIVRSQIISRMYLPEYEVRIGGTTSIDVTRKGIDKGHGIRKLLGICGWSVEDAIFIGDSIFPGGNDWPAREIGMDTVNVPGPDVTISEIERLLAGG